MVRTNNIQYILGFILIILLQILVLNRISFLGYAIPFFYIYFVLKLPLGYNRNLTILWSFLLGFIIDIFCNTPGINAASAVFIGFISPFFQKLFFISNDYEGQTPGMRLFGNSFIKYAVLIVLIHNIVLALIESFSLFNLKFLLFRIIFSTIITSLLIFAFEGFSKKKKRSTW